MKLTVQKAALEAAVKNLHKVINPKSALPVLNDIYFDVCEQERTARLTASDSETWLQYLVCLDGCEGEGRFCVSAETLRNALTELTDQPLTILATTESDQTLTIEHQTGRTHMPLDAADEYPMPTPTDGDTEFITLAGADIQANLRRTLWATANDDLRPQMSGVFFDFMPDGFYNVVASDGHVLMRCHVETDMHKPAASLLMPKKVAKLLPDLLTAMDEADLTFNDRQATVEQDAMTLTFRTPEQKYPNYGSVIPKEHSRRAILWRQTLLSRLKNVLPFANDSSQMVKMEFKADQLTLTAEDYDFSLGATDNVPCRLEGDALTLAVKGSSLIAVLSKLSATHIVIKASDPSRAITIEDYDDSEDREGNILGLCMPMLLND